MLVFFDYECPGLYDKCDCLLDKVVSVKKNLAVLRCLGCEHEYVIRLDDIKDGMYDDVRIRFIRDKNNMIEELCSSY